MMNVIGQLHSGDRETWGRIEMTKEFEWENGGVACY